MTMWSVATKKLARIKPGAAHAPVVVVVVVVGTTHNGKSRI